MFFRRPTSYTITLQRAHSLLNIPRDSTTSIVPSRDQIQEAFRAAAKRHHPDLANGAGTLRSNPAANLKNVGSTAYSTAKTDTVAFRECHEARELLLDYYVRRKYVHPEIIQCTKNKPRKDYEDESLFSVWAANRSFQMEVFLRLSLCLGLAAYVSSEVFAC
eukprot:CCRYP_003563-RA/>CCRYP_003563-RA protein AED:0.17 eAED:0.18 QI:0/0/0.5/1/0/0/2/131/161